MNKNNVRVLLKNAKGITLVALVVTIVIILILAGITIIFTIGPNGIIEQAKNAKNKYASSANSEREALNVLANQLDSGDYGSISSADLATVTAVPEDITSKQVTDKSGNIVYYRDDTALNNKDLSSVTTDTSKVTVSSGKVINDYIVYYKAATEDNISNGAVAYVDGKIIIGNGGDVNKAKSMSYVSLYGATSKRYSYTGISKGGDYSNPASDHQWHLYGTQGSDTVSYTIPITHLPDSETTTGVLNTVNASLSATANGVGGSTASITMTIKTDTGVTLLSKSGSQTVSFNLFSVDIGDATSITMTFSGSNYFSATDPQGDTSSSSFYANSISADYLIPKD